MYNTRLAIALMHSYHYKTNMMYPQSLRILVYAESSLSVSPIKLNLQLTLLWWYSQCGCLVYGFIKGLEQCLQIHILDISATLLKSVSGSWPCPPGNHLSRVFMACRTHFSLSCTVTRLSGSTSWTVIVQFLYTTSRQDVDINRQNENRLVIKITDLTWLHSIKTGSL